MSFKAIIIITISRNALVITFRLRVVWLNVAQFGSSKVRDAADTSRADFKDAYTTVFCSTHKGGPIFPP
jgi:hypothetical protein